MQPWEAARIFLTGVGVGGTLVLFIGRIMVAIGIGRIAAPTQVIAGAGDPSAPPASAVATMESIPGAGLTIIPDAAHLANVEQPEAFNAAMLRHLVGDATERGMAVRRRVLGDAHVDAALSEFTAP